MAERVTKLSKQQKKHRRDLSEAIANYDVERVQELLQQKPELNVMVNHELPLVQAAGKGSVEMVQLLLDAGADPNKGEESGDHQGALMHCAIHECAMLQEKGYEIAKLLIEHGAKIELFDANLESVLEKACMFNNLKLVKLLLDKGESVNSENYRGEMPLHHACMDGHLELAEFLISRGAEMNPDGFDSPLLVAVDRDKKEMVKLLLSKGADPNHKGPRGQTPFLQGCYRGDLEMIKLLVEGGADVNTVNSQGDTCAHFLCYRYPKKDTLLYLSNKGVNLYTKNNSGHSAFRQACLLACIEAVVYLLGAGFDAKKELEQMATNPVQMATMLPIIRPRTHSQKVFLLAELLIAMGCPYPTKGEIKAIIEMRNAPETTIRLCHWLVMNQKTPQTLQNSLRLYIRNLIGASVRIDNLIDGLPLPTKLKEFLKFEDMVKRESRDRCLGCCEYMDECECQEDDYDFPESDQDGEEESEGYDEDDVQSDNHDDDD